VDAILRVDRLVPIDAKFPLDNFERLAAAESDDDAPSTRRRSRATSRGTSTRSRSKYIRPDEGTYDFALMYLPAESVYYELVCGKTGALLQYAHEKRVFPVSPTTFTSQLQVIALGLKGLQIEQHAHEVMAYVAQLGKDFDRFKADFDVVGKHIGNAQSKYSEAERRLGSLRVEAGAGQRAGRVVGGRAGRPPACAGRRLARFRTIRPCLCARSSGARDASGRSPSTSTRRSARTTCGSSSACSARGRRPFGVAARR
jgi:hypothetical protein